MNYFLGLCHFEVIDIWGNTIGFVKHFKRVCFDLTILSYNKTFIAVSCDMLLNTISQTSLYIFNLAMFAANVIDYLLDSFQFLEASTCHNSNKNKSS